MNEPDAEAKPVVLRPDPGREFDFVEGCRIGELSNRASDPAVSVALVRVAAGRTTRWHSLRETEERYLIAGGRGIVEAGALPATEVGAGDLVYIPADCRQRIRNPGPGELVFYAICTPRFRPECYVDLEDGAAAPGS